MTDYASIADFYDLWSRGDPYYQQSLEFYLKLCMGFEGKIVELGVGTGRIALELAKIGKNVIGIDISKEMLEICRKKIQQFGVEDKLKVVNADIRNFSLKDPADLIYLPFRSIGHLVDYDSKLQMFKTVYNQLSSDGVFIFDHYIFGKEWAERHHGIPRLMSVENSLDGGGKYIWDVYLFDFENQIMDCTIIYETVGISREVITRRYSNFKFCWIYPEEIKKICSLTGFKIDKIYGEFDNSEFNSESNNQIWVLKKALNQ